MRGKHCQKIFKLIRHMEYNNRVMTSQVFYRKWRPQNLSQVVGQQHVTQTLSHAVESGHIAHAYLFCGPRGTGKTSTGRILAKAVNCLNPVKGEPCNDCQMCNAINEGSALDIIEIDAASNRGIDEIRELKEKVNYSPNQARYKVYIIDEVHMITKEAANAFLKTLEEPPPHAIFVLATTEPHKVLPTVLSRCQRFDFRRLSQSAVIDKLTFICGKEGIHTEPEALRLIAKVTTGSLRDAENVLEQLVAYYGYNIDLHQVQAMLGISGDMRTRELAKHIINKDITAGLNTINNISDDGIDLRQFNRELVNYLRDLLLVKSGSEDVVDTTSDDMAELKSLAASTSLDYILTAVKRFSESDIRLEYYSPLPLELALVGTILSASTEKQPACSVPTEAAKPIAQKQPVHSRPVKAEKIAEEKPATQPEETLSPEPTSANPPSDSVEPRQEPETSAPSITPDIPAAEPVAAGSATDIAYIRSQWKDFVNTLRGTGSKGNLDAFLRNSCQPVSIEDNILTLGFYAKFHKEYIEDQKYRFLVEKKLQEVFGHYYKIRCILIERSQEVPQKTSETESPVVKAALRRGAKLIS